MNFNKTPDIVEETSNSRFNLNQVVSVAILVAACLVALNIYKGQKKKGTQILHLQDEQRKKNEILLHIGDLNKKIKSYKQVFMEREHREIIDMITRVCADSNVKIISLKPQKAQSGITKKGSEKYNKAFFGLVIQVDSYHQLGEFISRLENSQTMLLIEWLQIEVVVGTSSGLAAHPESLKITVAISEVSFK